MKLEAVVSKCTKYRYSLSREWNKDKKKVLFIMLNPSKADDKIDDHTVKRCQVSVKCPNAKLTQNRLKHNKQNRHDFSTLKIIHK